MASSSSQRIQLGEIVGIHGLQGWLKIKSYTDPREGIFDYRPLIIGGEPQDEFEGKVHGKGLLLRLPGAHDRTAAQGWVGAVIEVHREQLPDLPEGQFYWSDLLGMTVRNREGATLGTVAGMTPTGANDVMTVKGEQEFLIPWIRDRYIDSVDLEQHLIVVDWDPEWR